MSLRRTPILVHLAGAIVASALVAFWALQLLAPAPRTVPAGPPPAPLLEPNAELAGRMFGDVSVQQPTSALNVQVSGVFAAGRSSSAVVSVDGKPARAVLLGHELAAGARLAEVRRDGITVDQAGMRTSYSVPPMAVATPSAPQESFQREGTGEGIVLTAPTVDTPASGAASGATRQTVTAPAPEPAQPAASPARNNLDNIRARHQGGLPGLPPTLQHAVPPPAPESQGSGG
jgi:general secretion pathway protein C